MSSTSQPGSKLFLNIFIVILLLIFVIWFLNLNDELDKKAEDVYLKKKLSEINSTLALTLYEFVVKGELGKMQRFNNGNPFVFLASHHQLPANYLGTVKNIGEISSVGVWVYEMETENVIYIMKTKNVIKRYQLKFEFEDLNNSGKFESTVDTVKEFTLKQVI